MTSVWKKAPEFANFEQNRSTNKYSLSFYHAQGGVTPHVCRPPHTPPRRQPWGIEPRTRNGDGLAAVDGAVEWLLPNNPRPLRVRSIALLQCRNVAIAARPGEHPRKFACGKNPGPPPGIGIASTSTRYTASCQAKHAALDDVPVAKV